MIHDLRSLVILCVVICVSPLCAFLSLRSAIGKSDTTRCVIQYIDRNGTYKVDSAMIIVRSIKGDTTFPTDTIITVKGARIDKQGAKILDGKEESDGRIHY